MVLVLVVLVVIVVVEQTPMIAAEVGRDDRAVVG